MAAAVPALDAAGVQEDLSKDLVGNGTRTFPVDQGGIAKVPSKSMIWQAAAAFTTALEKALTLLDGSKAKGQTSPYLLDNYAPILEETFAQDLEVLEGTLPLDLSGTFLRTGPNPKFSPHGRYHWFDGDGMIHSVRIKDSKASYCNSFVDTAKLRIETAANRSIIGKIGDKRGLSGLAHILLDSIKKLLGVVDASHGLGTANTALAYHAGRMLALHEGDAPYWIRIACEGLVETIGRVSYGGKLQHAFTAHPKIDPVTKELFAFGYSVEKAPHCWAVRCDANGELVADFPVPLERPVMMHDCALTENYFIIVDAPLLFTPDAIVKGHLPFTFDNTLPLKFGVINRYAQDSSEIKWFSVEPCMSFHVANAWETSSTAIELYLCTFKEFSLDDFTAAGPEAEPHLTRVTLDLATGEATSQLLCPLTGDFPTVPASLVARKTKWCYVAAFETSPFGAPLFYGITKVDLEAQGPETAVVGTIHHGHGRLGGEAYFVSREGPTANGEDNGYLITYVWDEQTQTSELVIYDAATMSSTPVGRVGMPQRVPFGFHCTWMTEEQMQEQRAG